MKFMWLLLAATLAGAPGQAQRPLSTPDLARKLSPVMVTISTPASTGSGVILDAAGVVVTNLHVVRGQNKAAVKLSNGDVYDDVSVVDVDERKDLVLLKIKAFNLTRATIGDSDKVRTGDRVVVMGSPLGLEVSMSDGLVSAVRDSGDGYRVFQTSAAASPGSSGGGMFNQYGELVGIVSSKIANGENLNFALPINYVRGLVSTTVRMTLAELAAKYPAAAPGGPAGPGPAASPAGSPATAASLQRLAAILSASGVQWTKVSDTEWSATYTGASLPQIKIFVSLFGDLVVMQGSAAQNPKLTGDQAVALLQRNFSMDLVKASLWQAKNDPQSTALMLLNETEIRLLDGPAVKRIADAIALQVDDIAGKLDAPAPAPPLPDIPAPRTTGYLTQELVSGHAALRYDPAVWKAQSLPEAGTFQFNYAPGDLYLKVIAERIQVPLERMADLVLNNLKAVAPDAKIVRHGYRAVSGLRMLYMEMEATTAGIAASYFCHVYSDANGTVQLMGYTGRNLIGEMRVPIEKMVSGFFVR